MITHNLNNVAISTNKNQIVLKHERGGELVIQISEATCNFHRARMIKQVNNFTTDQFYSAESISDIIRNAKRIVIEYNTLKIDNKLCVELDDLSLDKLNQFLEKGIVETYLFGLRNKELCFATIKNQRITNPNGITGIGKNNNVVVYLAK